MNRGEEKEETNQAGQRDNRVSENVQKATRKNDIWIDLLDFLNHRRTGDVGHNLNVDSETSAQLPEGVQRIRTPRKWNRLVVVN